MPGMKYLLRPFAGFWNIQPPISRLPIFFICSAGFVYSVLAFFPGWMSPDSVSQYSEAKSKVFYDWHPVLMAWWWSKLDRLYEGPAPMLLQNLVLYWGAWALLACGARHRIGHFSYAIPLLGFWPGILFPLGQVWKDVLFACSMFFAWAVLINVHLQGRRPLLIERVAILVLCALSFGVKTNGLTTLPFLMYFWVVVEGWYSNRLLGRLTLAVGLTGAAVLFAMAAVPSNRIVKTSPFQYTQSYDLLAISVETGEIVLPKYITDRVGSSPSELKKLYWIGGNNLMFYGQGGSLATRYPEQLRELNERWRYAIAKYPDIYLKHRWGNLVALLRIGADHTAVVAAPTTVENPWGFSFSRNRFADWLASGPDLHPAMFFPWVYTLLLVAAMLILLSIKFESVMVATMGGSAIFFVLPHFFVTPAADYRYLYYSYFCAMVLGAFASAVAILLIIKQVAKRIA
jgi:hypothetical protein